MNDEEIQCVILRIGCNDPEGVTHLSRVNKDYGVDYERVLSNARILKDEGLVTDRLMGGSTPGSLAGDVVITEQGRREYKSKCEQK